MAVLTISRCPPNWLILAWDSVLGSVVIWSGCLLVPAFALFLSIGRERHLLGTAILLLWTTITGAFGFWFWLHAVFNAYPIG